MSNWVCLNCGHDKGDMILLGFGFYKCPNCGTKHLIKKDGSVMVVIEPKKEA